MILESAYASFLYDQDVVLEQSPAYSAFVGLVGTGPVAYSIWHTDVAQWEHGVGAVSVGGTFQRTTVTGSSNSGNKVMFSAGRKIVRLDAGVGESALSFTPTWGSTGTQPALGNGTLVGRYVVHGKLVTAFIALTMGSTTTYGTGHWQFALPTLAPAGETTLFPQGTGLAYDVSAATNYVCACQVNAAADMVELFPHGAVQPVTAAVPFTWANTDLLRFNVTYMKA